MYWSPALPMVKRWREGGESGELDAGSEAKRPGEGSVRTFGIGGFHVTSRQPCW